MTAPLSRNRNYQLLWSSQALAEFGCASVDNRLPAAGVVADGIGIGYRTGAGYKRRSGTCCRFAGRGLGGPVESQEGHARLRSGTGNCRHDSCRRAGGRSGERCAYSDSGCGDGRVLGAVRTSGKRLFTEPDVDGAGTPTAVAMNAARGHLGQLSGTAAGGFPVCCRKIRAIRGGHADPCRVLLLAHVHPPAGAPGTTRAGRSTRPRDCGRLSLGVPAPPGSSHRLVRRGAQPVLRSLLHRHHRGGTSTRRIVWRGRHYGGDVRCRWDPWRPGRPLPAAEGHSLCLDRRGVLGSDGCHSAGSLRQQCLSAGIAIRWYGISRPDCGHHDRYLPTSAHTRRNARQDDREQLSGVGYPPSLVRGGCADTAARPGQIASANL